MTTAVAAVLSAAAGRTASGQELEWAVGMGGTSYDDPTGIAVDAQGSVVSTGGFDGSADFDPGPGMYILTPSGGFEYDIYVSKLDASGQFLWAAAMGGTLVDVAWGIALDSSGNVYTAGSFQGTADFDPGPGTMDLVSAGDDDVFVSKLDAAGHFVWAKRIGGAAADVAYTVAVDAAGNVYLAGTFSGTVDFNPGPGTRNLTSAGGQDIFIVKLDSGGSFVWARRMGGASDDWCNHLRIDATGNVHACGVFRGTADFDPGPGAYDLTAAGGSDIFIVKLTASGEFTWARGMGGPQDDFGNGIDVDAGGSVLTAGVFRATADFDPGPGTYDLTSAGDRDIFVSKLDAGGNFLWARRMGSTAGDAASDLRLDRSGNVYTTGQFRLTADFDPGPAEYPLTSSGSLDAFVLELDPAGHFLWANAMGGLSFDSGDALTVDGASRLWVTGAFQEDAAFDASTTLTSAGNDDAFVARLQGLSASFVPDAGYGLLLFPPRETHDASLLVGDVYDSRAPGVVKRAHDRFFLSSQSRLFEPVVVDDEVHVNGANSGLGPYTPQLGVPPYALGWPIEENLLPLPAPDVTSLLPSDSAALFELLDTDREIYGNTALYLVRDCGIWLDKAAGGEARLHWVSEQVQVDGAQSHLDVVSGIVSQLRLDGNFTRSCFLGSFSGTTQAVDARPAPAPGDAVYYLVSGTCASPIGYGNSSQGPRQGLPPSAPCQ